MIEEINEWVRKKACVPFSPSLFLWMIAGHVPGAIHYEWLHSVTRDDNRVFKSPQELAELLRNAHVSLDKPLITYCQAGVRATHVAFVLEMLGAKDVRVYDGSMAEYANVEPAEKAPLVV